MCRIYLYFFFFFNDTATTEIYTLSLHDALPIYVVSCWIIRTRLRPTRKPKPARASALAGNRSGWRGQTNSIACKCFPSTIRSEEHTSELQSLAYLVCRLLLEKKKTHKDT